MATLILCFAIIVSILLGLSIILPDRRSPPWQSLGQVGLFFNLVAGLVILTIRIEPARNADVLHWVATFDAGMGLACILAGVRRLREAMAQDQDRRQLPQFPDVR